MTIREQNERLLQSKIDQLQRDMENMRNTAPPVTTVYQVQPPQPARMPTPVERYVIDEYQPRVKLIDSLC
jgi:hypothetical protein